MLFLNGCYSKKVKSEKDNLVDRSYLCAGMVQILVVMSPNL